MAPHRPRASDFDAASAWGRAERPSSPVHHQRRASPTYEPHSPHYHPPSQHQQGRLTPEESLDRYNHQDHRSNRHDQPPSTKNSYTNGYRQGGRDDFFEKRRIERENATVEFWPKSPNRPYGEEKKRHHSSHNKDERHERSKDKKNRSRHEKTERKSKKHHHSSDSESDRSEQRHPHKSHKKHKSHKSRKSHKHGSEDIDSDSDEEGKERERIEKSKSNPIEEVEDDLWMEKEVATAVETSSSTNNVTRKDSLSGPLRPTIVEEPEPIDEEDVGEVGPMPYNHVTGKAMDPKEFGRALRPGEGSAMAAFIEAGERIPRRGEIGLTGVEIEKFENVGYVMSGSRHRRMNAVRIRKENQVISAEEKRGILKMQAEEKAKREGQIISSFRELVDTKLQETG